MQVVFQRTIGCKGLRHIAGVFLHLCLRHQQRKLFIPSNFMKFDHAETIVCGFPQLLLSSALKKQANFMF